MISRRIDPAILEQQIKALLEIYPELAEDELFRSDMIEGSTDLVEFLRELEHKRQEAVTMTEAIGETVERLRQRQQRFHRRDEAIRGLMFKMLQVAHLRKMELPEATLSIRLGVPKVIVTDEAALPDEFCRIKREPDKVKIKTGLLDGAIPGATLSNAEDTLAIRIK